LPASRFYLAWIIALLALGYPPVPLIRSVSAAALASGESFRPVALRKAMLNQSVSVRAEVRRDSGIALGDGHDLMTAYVGQSALTRTLEQNAARPLAMAAADFDEDGVADLASSYATGDAAPSESGIITLLKGNADAIYPNSREAQQHKQSGEYTDAPFLSPALAVAVPEAADFIGAGDFDADGHRDLVTAARGSRKLYLLSGDGQGGFGAARAIELSGAVTSLVTGEINRRDGLEDIVVGVTASDGPQVMVFENPRGALKGTPEIFALPAAATALALGQLDEDYPMDLAVGAGSDVLIVHGRDRCLALSEPRQASVPPATITRRRFPFAIQSIALGDFTGDHRPALALLSGDASIYVLSQPASKNTKGARAKKQRPSIEQWHLETLAANHWSSSAQLVRAQVSSAAADDLVIVDSITQQLGIAAGRSVDASASAARVMRALAVDGGPVAAMPMRLNADALSDLVILRNNQVAPSVAITAAGAIITVNSDQDETRYVADNFLTLREAIKLANGSLSKSALTPAEQAQVTGDPGPNQLDTIGFNIPGAGVHTIKAKDGLDQLRDATVIDGTSQPGFAALPLIELDGENSGATGPQNALAIFAGKCTVRGLVINRFGRDGINMAIQGGNLIEGNFIGTDSSGTLRRGNGRFGVAVEERSPMNTIGGATPQARNLIADNSVGVRFLGDFASQNSNDASPANLVQGNLIGTDITGENGLGNVNEGVLDLGQANNLIGGTDHDPGVCNRASNLIANNGASTTGIAITGSGAMGNLIQGNFIGTDLSGKAPLGNASEGVLIINGAARNTIGGTVAGARNLISSNQHSGVVLGSVGDVSLNMVVGNFIGTDATGSASLGNARDGVLVSAATDTMILNNVIGANGFDGISLGGLFIDPFTQAKIFGSKGSDVMGNFIGTDATATIDLGNLGNGIFVENNSLMHTIQNNTIAFNKNNGVYIPNAPSADVSQNTSGRTRPGFRIRIGKNSIFANAALGIDLGDPGVTVNHLGSKREANIAQNFPELLTATSDGQLTTVLGTLTSAPNATFTLEFYANPPAAGAGATGVTPCARQGKSFAFITTIKTNANGNAAFNIAFPQALPGGFINALATNVDGNTSEFSACAQADGPLGPSVREVTVTPDKIMAAGVGFAAPVTVLVNDVPFAATAKVKDGIKVTQTGRLADGRSIAEAIPAGVTVRIRFHNASGGETEVPFRN